MDRTERHQMKHDEFVERTMQLVERVGANPQPFLVGAAVVVVVVLGAWGYWSMSAARRARTAEWVSQGLAAITAPLASPDEARPADPYRPSFADPAARARAAVARLAEAAEGSAPPARLARALRGIARLQAGDDGALEDLEAAYAEWKDDPTLGGPIQAAYALALEGAGRHEEAVTVWQRLADAEREIYPRDLALAGLARAREAAGDTDGAREAYQRIIDLYGNSAAADEARDALARLE
ncbi:MAG: hypothetical protein D6718_09250 [Acidobacteria bacterium]|nr:MAG: hypothetical protein D6718_09250 [Acidobacteriota bacterium]